MTHSDDATLMSTPTRHWEFTEAGGPDVLRLANGTRQLPGHGDVRLKVEAMSLNRSDLMFLRDGYVESPTFPSRFGSEVAGVVEAVGPGVTGVSLGDRVTTVNAFPISVYGTFGDTAVVPARALLQVPKRFTPAQAASFGFAYLTNFFAFFEEAHIRATQTVIVTAASSTTGLAALPMLRSAGAISIATTRTSKKRDELLRLGADHVVVTDEEDLTERVMEITGGRGADVAFDCLPATLGEKVTQSLKVRGHWIVYGFMTDPDTFPWWPVAMRTLRFTQYSVYRYTGNPFIQLAGDDEVFDEAKQAISAALESGLWPPVPVSREYHGIEKVQEAAAYMASGEALGKIVITL